MGHFEGGSCQGNCKGHCQGAVSRILNRSAVCSDAMPQTFSQYCRQVLKDAIADATSSFGRPRTILTRAVLIVVALIVAVATNRDVIEHVDRLTISILSIAVVAIAWFVIALILAPWRIHRAQQDQIASLTSTLEQQQDSRPRIQIQFISWSPTHPVPEMLQGPELEAFNVGQTPALRVRFGNPNDLRWLDSGANVQGSTTIAAGLPPARFAFRPPVSLSGNSSTEFRILYNDAAGLREFDEKWRLGIDGLTPQS